MLSAITALVATSWPTPAPTPDGLTSLVGNTLTVNQCEAVYIEPEAELITGWDILNGMAVGIVPEQPVVFELEWGQTYTVRGFTPLPEDGTRSYYETVITVPGQTRRDRIASVYRRLIAVYLEWRDLRVDARELMEAQADQ